MFNNEINLLEKKISPKNRFKLSKNEDEIKKFFLNLIQ